MWITLKMGSQERKKVTFVSRVRPPKVPKALRRRKGVGEMKEYKVNWCWMLSSYEKCSRCVLRPDCPAAINDEWEAIEKDVGQNNEMGLVYRGHSDYSHRGPRENYSGYSGIIK
jgi:hypothetical protein